MHPLQSPPVVALLERAAGSRLLGFTDLNDLASHPCALLHFAGRTPFTLFAKVDLAERLEAELRGLELIAAAGVRTPSPVAIVATPAGAVLLTHGVPHVPAPSRTSAQWAFIGQALARLHTVHNAAFGLAAFDGWFGPLPQDNTPLPDWPTFYAERRLRPRLRDAVDAGHLPPSLAAGVDRVIERMPVLAGPLVVPTLLHGDAQQNNLLTTETEAVAVDACPYYGHPELDLALLDYFAPVPPVVLDAYRELTPIDADFPERRELWRLFGYLAVVAVDGASPFGRPFLDRIAAAVARYR